MSDQESASAEKAKRTVAILKLTGRNEEGREPRTIGEALHAVFADCSEAGSHADLEETDSGAPTGVSVHQELPAGPP